MSTITPTPAHRALANQLNDCIDWPTRFYDEDHAAQLIAENEAAQVRLLRDALTTIKTTAWPISDPLGVNGGTINCLNERLEHLRLIAHRALTTVPETSAEEQIRVLRDALILARDPRPSQQWQADIIDKALGWNGAAEPVQKETHP